MGLPWIGPQCILARRCERGLKDVSMGDSLLLDDVYLG